MAANVTIKGIAFTDPRVTLLAQLAGYNRYEALGRLAHLWEQNTELDSYVLSEAVVRGCMGVRGAVMVECDLAEWTDDGRLRIRGTVGQTDWLGKKRRAGASGGRKRSKAAEANLRQNRSERHARPKQDRSTPGSTAEVSPNPQDQDQDQVPDASSSRPPLGEAVARLWATYERLSAERGLDAKPFVPGDEQGIRTLLGLRWTIPQIELGLAATAARAAAFENERAWWDGKRNWRPEVLREALALHTSGAPARGPGALVVRDGGRARPRDRARELLELADRLEAAGE